MIRLVLIITAVTTITTYTNMMMMIMMMMVMLMLVLMLMMIMEMKMIMHNMVVDGSDDDGLNEVLSVGAKYHGGTNFHFPVERFTSQYSKMPQQCVGLGLKL